MSAGPAGSPWSAQQREWLQAMGLEVWVPVSADAGADADAGERTAMPPSTSSAGAGAAPARRDATQPPATPSQGPDGRSPGRAKRPGLADAGDDRVARLLHALLRAARRDAAGQLAALLPDDLDALARDPAAKRALWPRLRALRRGGR